MSVDATALWIVIVAAGIGTYGLRVSFIALFGRLDEVPPRLTGVLRFVPAALLAALVAPALVSLTGPPAPGLVFAPREVVAGATAAVVAWRTENALATIGVGMVALWTLQALV